MAWTMVEGIINALNMYLQTNLPAKITALNTEYDDTYTLADVVAFYVGQKDMDQVPQFPALFILGGDANVAGFNGTYTDAEYEIAVSIMIMDQDAEAIQRRLYRYVRAVWECIVDAHAALSLNGARIIGNPVLGYSDTFGSTSQYIAEGHVVFKSRNQENR